MPYMNWACRRREGSKVDGTEDRTELQGNAAVADKDALTAMAGMFETRMLRPQYGELLLEPSVDFAHVLWSASLLTQSNMRAKQKQNTRRPSALDLHAQQEGPSAPKPKPKAKPKAEPKEGRPCKQCSCHMQDACVHRMACVV